ncbi:MAG: hypothetical protein IT158_10705 [Bryobacterales bacterium]|nr:hypothetical protein [Bryobacterales bacterium]
MRRRPRRLRYAVPSGFYRFERRGGGALEGYGEGEFIQLRDEFGNVWRGHAERAGGDCIRYRFRDGEGNTVSGISDRYGILLRDEHGNVWRGFLG